MAFHSSKDGKWINKSYEESAVGILDISETRFLQNGCILCITLATLEKAYVLKAGLLPPTVSLT